MMSLGASLLVAFAAASVLMSGLWFIQRHTGNAGIVDIGWSGSIPLLVIGFAWTHNIPALRAWLFILLVCLWGGRLVWHIHARSHGKPEDRRYRTLRESWGPRAQANFYWFFQFQALAAAVFALPYFLIFGQPRETLHPLEILGAGLFLLAWLGEAVADAQLNAFKRNPDNQGKVCDVGLWSVSRHPNYFFEWVIWVAIAVAAFPAPHGYLAVVCPILMLFFLFKVTGIPATEEQALRSKGDAYRRYQQTTSPFIPWFKRKA